MAWGYTLREWQEETPHNRGLCLAHHLHRNLREAYTVEKSTDKGGKGNAGDYAFLMQQMGLPT